MAGRFAAAYPAAYTAIDGYLREVMPDLRDFKYESLGKEVKRLIVQFPSDVRERVFLLGTSSETEPLKKSHGNSLEAIGKQLATEYERDETELWVHMLLAHNAAERQHLNAKVKAILF